MTQANAIAANLFTNDTPTKTIVPINLSNSIPSNINEIKYKRVSKLFIHINKIKEK